MINLNITQRPYGYDFELKPSGRVTGNDLYGLALSIQYPEIAKAINIIGNADSWIKCYLLLEISSKIMHGVYGLCTIAIDGIVVEPHTANYNIGDVIEGG